MKKRYIARDDTACTAVARADRAKKMQRLINKLIKPRKLGKGRVRVWRATE